MTQETDSNSLDKIISNLDNLLKPINVAIALGAEVASPANSYCYALEIKDYEGYRIFYGLYCSEEDARRFAAILVMGKWLENYRFSMKTFGSRFTLDENEEAMMEVFGPFLLEIREKIAETKSLDTREIVSLWLSRLDVSGIIDIYFSSKNRSMTIERLQISATPEFDIDMMIKNYLT